MAIFSTCLHDALALETAGLNTAVIGNQGAAGTASIAEIEDGGDSTFTFVIGDDPTSEFSLVGVCLLV